MVKTTLAFLCPACTLFCCRRILLAIAALLVQFWTVCCLFAAGATWVMSFLFPSFTYPLYYFGGILPGFLAAWIGAGFVALSYIKKAERGRRIMRMRTQPRFVTESKELGNALARCQGGLASPADTGERAEGCSAGMPGGQPAA